MDINKNDKQRNDTNHFALLLAGKLAIAARLVTTSDAKNLSQRIRQMEAALDAYDNLILLLSNEE
jgi:hypothetical protein